MSRIFLALAMLALNLPIIINTQVAASFSQEQPVLNWNRVNIPSEDYIAAPGSDVLQLLSTQDSTLYAVVSNDGNHLYSSSGEGSSWERYALLEENFVELAECPGRASVLYYATTGAVFRSEDGGRSFTILPYLPDADGHDSYITAVSGAVVDGEEIIAVSVASRQSAGAGGVFLIKPDDFLSRWYDSSPEASDVYDIGFIPGYTRQIALAAAGLYEGELVVKTMLGNAGWSNTWADGIFPPGDQGLTGFEGASLVFMGESSPDYPVMIVGLNGDQGGLYRVELAGPALGSSVYSLTERSVGAISSLEAGRDGVILAGAARKGEIYVSFDRGETWNQPDTRPTGGAVTSSLILEEGFYISTSGTESAVSFSGDGLNYCQLAFVDTRIDALLDYAVSPDYSADGTIYLLTWGGGSSLWRSTDRAKSWTRCLYSSAAEGVMEKIGLSPEYGHARQVVYLAGEKSGAPCIWVSQDGAVSYIARECPYPVDCWEITGDRELLIGSYDGVNGVVLGTKNAGFSFRKALAGDAPVCSLATSSADHVLLGDIYGSVWISSDGGASFSILPGMEEASGAITVAFHSSFAENGQIFIASDAPGGGVHTATVSTGFSWKRLDEEDEFTGCRLKQLAIGDDGLIYAADSQPLNDEADRGKVLRFVNSGKGRIITDTITKGLEAGCCLEKMKAVNDSLWAMDISNGYLLCYTDTLNRPPELLYPGDGEGSVGTPGDGLIHDVKLEWSTMSGAGAYHWQVCDKPSFSGVKEDMEGITTGTEAELPELDGQASYFWRVMAVSPVSSPWSAPAGFTTSISTNVVAPGLERPLPGEKDVSVRPIFQWEKIEGASCYELVVGTSPGLDNPAIAYVGSDALNTNAWQAEEKLEHDTGYFWKVRAIDGARASQWSAVGSFETTGQPVIPGEPVPEVPVITTTVPMTTVTLPVTTVVNIGEVTMVVPTLEVPGQTVIITRVGSEGYPPTDVQIPQWGYGIIVLLGAVLFVLIVLLGVVIIRKPLHKQ